MYDRDRKALMHGVTTFNYLGRPLDQTYNDCPEVTRNIKQEHRVWGRLGNLLRMEGAYPRVAEILYSAVIQVVLLFGLDTWILSAAMERTVERTHPRFLRHITGKWARRN